MGVDGATIKAQILKIYWSRLEGMPLEAQIISELLVDFVTLMCSLNTCDICKQMFPYCCTLKLK